MIDKIRKTLKSRKITFLDKSNFFSVNLMIEILEKPHIIFEKRSNNLKTQPNEISFAGGKIEENETKIEAMYRETEEELGIKKDDLILLGELDTMVSSYNRVIYPFVTLINKEVTYTLNPYEVEYIIKVPLEYFLNNNPKSIMASTTLKIKDCKDFYEVLDYNFKKGIYPIYYYNYNDIRIWGITAKIIKNFIDIIKKA